MKIEHYESTMEMIHSSQVLFCNIHTGGGEEEKDIYMEQPVLLLVLLQYKVSILGHKDKVFEGKANTCMTVRIDVIWPLNMHSKHN